MTSTGSGSGGSGTAERAGPDHPPHPRRAEQERLGASAAVPAASSEGGAQVTVVPAPQPPDGAAAAGPPGPSSAALPHVLRMVGSVVAPVSLLTALMYYFGVLHAFWFFGSFGVDYSIFGLSTHDYLLRSADGLFVPLTVVAAVFLAALWAGRLLPAGLNVRGRATTARALRAVTACFGVVLVALAGIGVVEPARFHSLLTLPGLSLSAGVLLLLASSRAPLWAPRTPGDEPRTPPAAGALAEWAAVLVLVSVGLFWAAADYSAAVGTRRGEQVQRSLSTWSDATLYSEKSLNLAVPGVREIECRQPEAAYAFRYDGLKLITEAGDQYLFLPATWAQGDGTAIVIPRTATLRLEFTAPGVSGRGTC